MDVLTRTLWPCDPALADRLDWQVYADALLEVEPALGEFLTLGLAAAVEARASDRARLLERSRSIASTHKLAGAAHNRTSNLERSHRRYGLVVGLSYGSSPRTLPSACLPIACALYSLRLERPHEHVHVWSRLWPTLRRLVLTNTRFELDVDSIAESMPWLRELELWGSTLPSTPFGPWSALTRLVRLSFGVMLLDPLGLHRLLILLIHSELPESAMLELTVLGLDFHWAGPTDHALPLVLARFTRVTIYARAMDPRLARTLRAHAAVELRVNWLERFD